jgi:excisionase family DNA binding protein
VGSRPSPNDRLTIPQAAALAGLHRSVMHRLVASGQCKGEKITPRLWLVRRGDLDEFLRLERPSGVTVAQRSRP